MCACHANILWNVSLYFIRFRHFKVLLELKLETNRMDYSMCCLLCISLYAYVFCSKAHCEIISCTEKLFMQIEWNWKGTKHVKTFHYSIYMGWWICNGSTSRSSNTLTIELVHSCVQHFKYVFFKTCNYLFYCIESHSVQNYISSSSSFFFWKNNLIFLCHRKTTLFSIFKQIKTKTLSSKCEMKLQIGNMYIEHFQYS